MLAGESNVRKIFMRQGRFQVVSRYPHKNQHKAGDVEGNKAEMPF